MKCISSTKQQQLRWRSRYAAGHSRKREKSIETEFDVSSHDENEVAASQCAKSNCFVWFTSECIQVEVCCWLFCMIAKCSSQTSHEKLCCGSIPHETKEIEISIQVIKRAGNMNANLGISRKNLQNSIRIEPQIVPLVRGSCSNNAEGLKRSINKQERRVAQAMQLLHRGALRKTKDISFRNVFNYKIFDLR